MSPYQRARCVMPHPSWRPGCSAGRRILRSLHHLSRCSIFSMSCWCRETSSREKISQSLCSARRRTISSVTGRQNTHMHQLWKPEITTGAETTADIRREEESAVTWPSLLQMLNSFGLSVSFLLLRGLQAQSDDPALLHETLTNWTSWTVEPNHFNKESPFNCISCF